MKSARKNKYGSATFFFGAGALAYFWTSIELITGELATKSSGSIKGDKDPYFFWFAITAQITGCLVLVGWGLYNRYKLKINRESSPEYGLFFSNRTGNFIAAALIILGGLLFLILPANELLNGSAFGGTIFHSHQLDKEPDLFLKIVSLHLFLSLLPM